MVVRESRHNTVCSSVWDGILQRVVKSTVLVKLGCTNLPSVQAMTRHKVPSVECGILGPLEDFKHVVVVPDIGQRVRRGVCGFPEAVAIKLYGECTVCLECKDWVALNCRSNTRQWGRERIPIDLEIVLGQFTLPRGPEILVGTGIINFIIDTFELESIKRESPVSILHC